MAQGIAQVAGILVGGILPPGNVGLGEDIPQLLPGVVQQRAHHAHTQHFAVGSHGAQPGEARPPQKVEQQGLSLVVPVVGQGNGLGLAFLHGLAVEAVARLPRPVFPRMLRRLGAIDQQGQLPALADIPHKGFVGIGGLAPQAVVHMNGA